MTPTNQAPAPIKSHLTDIQLIISWREFANQYFHKSSSWFYHKMNGIDGNGGPGTFTPEELSHLRQSLRDLSARLRRAADTLPQE